MGQCIYCTYRRRCRKGRCGVYDAKVDYIYHPVFLISGESHKYSVCYGFGGQLGSEVTGRYRDVRRGIQSHRWAGGCKMDGEIPSRRSETARGFIQWRDASVSIFGIDVIHAVAGKFLRPPFKNPNGYASCRRPVSIISPPPARVDVIVGENINIQTVLYTYIYRDRYSSGHVRINYNSPENQWMFLVIFFFLSLVYFNSCDCTRIILYNIIITKQI